jgi:tetratricopeptide (TPR) repeat protein
MRKLFKRRSFQLALAGLLLLAFVVWGAFQWLDRYVAKAEQFITNHEWPKARETLDSYLRFRPGDATARLMMAEAFIRDNKLAGEDKVESALRHLSQIPDTSPHAADARLQEGRLLLLLRLQPGRAERAFRRSLQLDPDRVETHSLLWKLYDLTDRWDSAGEHVWRLMELLPEQERVNRLRDWYLSEFSPGTANAELERRLGLLGETERPGDDSDRRRLEAFVMAEPDWADGHAILARWYHRQGGLHQAGAQLDLAEQLPGGSETPLVIATRVSVSLELGDFDRAERAFQRWPAPHDGYEYWKTAGMIADQVTRDASAACQAFEKAIQTTAGKSDWLTQHRLAQCLLRQGETGRAAVVRLHSKSVELLMENPVHAGLRRDLLTPLAAQTIARMIDLYRQLERHREVEAWSQLTADDRQATVSPSVGVPGSAAVESAGNRSTAIPRDSQTGPESTSR